VQCLIDWGYELIDCQVESEHLARFGAINISRKQFTRQLAELIDQQPASDAWERNQRK
ncbi:MAG TPA: leucyl/phenylalanyl-tRNA--protein transferase, partial [Gammaproteobacteria bacterium]|nr:leucyl/phenylalanyl-tRNA--protein transferase [Gammaproteobacteria bacterium]